MGHVFLQVHSGEDGGAFERGVQALSAFKQVGVTDSLRCDFASAAVAPARKEIHRHIERSKDGQIWLIDLGTWLPLPARSGADTAWLIEQYRQHGAQGMARSLQGLFALLIVDRGTRQVHAVTDRCGSLHLYYRRTADGVAFCSSSAVLAGSSTRGAAKLDPIGVHEFVATGIIYEERSLWAGVTKIGPASVLTVENGAVRSERYWSFAEVKPESLTLEQATEATYGALTEVLRALPACEQPLVSDLTGGYDSRFLLAGLLQSGCAFDTTVSGSDGHPDVTVAAGIAQALSLRHGHIVAPPFPTAEEFDAALRMTDGEYDAFDYARILSTHRKLSVDHGMSLNGSFGELARGYWWELLWPRLAGRQSLDTGMVARKRFAAIPYDSSVFADAARLGLAGHMGEVAQRAVAHLNGAPNTTQMDCLYYTLRMQRWQGRIASSTNQLWRSFSPIGFAQVLEPILNARADSRFRSLLVRALFARFEPRLAHIPLEHGYPPMPATIFNAWRFAPLFDHYGGKVVGKVRGRLGLNAKLAPQNADRQRDAAALRQRLLDESGILAWSAQPKLLETGLFREEGLAALLADTGASGARLEQWRRLVTLETLLRKIP